jgi:hypothetical protein
MKVLELRKLIREEVRKIVNEVSEADAKKIKWDYPDVDSNDLSYEYNPEADTYTIMAPITGVDLLGKKYTGVYREDVKDIEDLDDLDVDYKRIEDIKKK